MKLTIYQATLQVYAEQHSITLEQALETAIEQSKGKPDAVSQISKYRNAYHTLKHAKKDNRG